MPKISLLGGSYSARSPIAATQRCVNLYPEKNPEGASAPYTYYPTAGLKRRLSLGTQTPWRGLYAASNGELFGVAGNSVYYIDQNYAATLLGTLPTTASTPVAMIDNTNKLLIVDGSSNGWLVDLNTHAFSTVTDSTLTFRGGTSLAYLDGYVILNLINTQSFYSTLNGDYVFDGLWIAKKNTQPDRLQAVAGKQQEIWLIGEQTTEVWYNAGNDELSLGSLPFRRMPGTLIEYGTAAKYSVAHLQSTLLFIARTREGRVCAIRIVQYEAAKVSNYAIEAEWGNYGDVSDAIATTYFMDGHSFYEVTFPSANKTWVLDVGQNEWHEKAYLDPDTNQLSRSRINCHALAYGKHVVGDYANGCLYTMENDVYTDDDKQVIRIVSLPHLGSDGKRISHNRFIADIQTGEGPETLELSLRWSDNRGRTFGNPVMRTIGSQSDFLAVATWWNLGQARDRVYELSWSTNTRTAIQGAYIEVTESET